MFGDVDRGTAVLTAKSEPLQNANDQQRDRSEPSCGLIGRQQADDCRGATHNRQGDEKGVFAADQVSDTAEKERAEGSNEEADSEGGQVGDVGERLIAGRIKLGRKDGGQAAEDVEVV